VFCPSEIVQLLLPPEPPTTFTKPNWIKLKLLQLASALLLYPSSVPNTGLVQLSSQVVSGIYLIADAWVVAALVAFQYRLEFVRS